MYKGMPKVKYTSKKSLKEGDKMTFDMSPQK